MDELIKKAFLTALKTRLKKPDLPKLFNLFWADYVLPCGTQSLDIKYSTYKKLSTFYLQWLKKGLLQLRN